jgi:glycerol-3-phosphate dehydrogenase subunit B
MRSANIARIFDSEANVDALAAIIAREAGDCEAVLLPAFLGIANGRVLDELREKSGREIYVVATLPPSVPGVRAQLALRRAFERAGGVYMLGDTVVGYDMVDGRIAKVYSANHSNIGLEADDYVLATGSYFSRGLEATREGVCEPIFGLDVDAATDRGEWYRRDLFEAQPFEKFGVVTDEALHAVKEGKAVENLYVCGAGLSGFNPVKEQCGAGVSMLTALRVADNILKK